MPALAIQILYKCTCHPTERTVTMAARRDGEDIKTWMDKLTQVLSDDHNSKSPKCASRWPTYVKVPISNEDGAMIGGAVPPHAPEVQ
jgi:hypothetical protein